VILKKRQRLVTDQLLLLFVMISGGSSHNDHLTVALLMMAEFGAYMVILLFGIRGLLDQTCPNLSYYLMLVGSANALLALARAACKRYNVILCAVIQPIINCIALIFGTVKFIGNLLFYLIKLLHRQQIAFYIKAN